MAVSVICLFLTVPWVVLQCAIVAHFLVILTFFKITHFLSMRAYFVFDQRRPLRHARIPRGTGGPEHPLALKNTLSSACQRKAITMAFRWQADVSVFYRGRGRALCLLGIVFLRNTELRIPSPIDKKKRENVVKTLDPTPPPPSGSAHAQRSTVLFIRG